MRNTLFAVVLAMLLIGAPAGAAAQDGGQPGDPLQLFEAYQAGYLQVVSVCCFTLYSSIGIIATDYANGFIDDETARYALSENALLLSSCTATILEIGRLTPEGDAAAHRELDRLEELLAALGQLLTSLDMLIDDPGDEQAAEVEAARSAVETLLDNYVNTE